MSENWKFIPHREVNASLALGLKIVFAALLFFFGAANANASTINRPPNYISLKSGLVGYWTFDGKDLNTGAAMDASGQGNHGALVNMSTSTSRVPGKLGQGLKFDGVDDWVNVPDIILGNAESSDLRVVGGKAYFQYYTGSFQILTGNTSINNGQWHQVVGTGNGTLNSIYVDGVNDGELSTTGTPNIKIEALASRDDTYSPSQGYTGLLDDVRIYNRALEASEIAELYAYTGGTPPPPAGDTTAPSTPSNLSASAVSANQINLSWTASTDNAGVTG